MPRYGSPTVASLSYGRCAPSRAHGAPQPLIFSFKSSQYFMFRYFPPSAIAKFHFQTTPAAKALTGVPLVRHSRQATHKNHSFLAPDANQNRHNPPDDQKPRQNRTNFREYIIFSSSFILVTYFIIYFFQKRCSNNVLKSN